MVIVIIWIAGIFFSRFLQSVSTIAACLLSLVIFTKPSEFKKAVNSGLFKAFALIFFLHLFSIINTDNTSAFIDIFKNKIPFLFIPLALYMVKDTDNKYYLYIQHFFIICCLVSSGWSFYTFLKDKETYIQLYAQGQVMPTLIHHVSFSLLIAVAILFIIENLQKATSGIDKMIQGFLLVWMVFYLHILSVRTGLVLFYVSLLIIILYTLVKLKKPLVATGILLFLSLAAFLAFQNIPTLKNKLNYTQYSLEQYKNKADSSNQLSDSRRILSDKIGIELILNNKLNGVGLGDIKDEMNAIYAQRYPEFKEEVYSRIHNQYLYTTCGTGIISGIIFLLCIVTPLFIFIKQKQLISALLYFQLLLVMLWEPFIQHQLGTSIFFVLLSIGFMQMKKQA